MGSFVEHIKEKAKQTKKTILLPETMDDRTYYAAEQAMKEGIADLILIGSRAEIDEHVKSTGVDISGARIVDPANYEKLDEYVELLYITRKAKGIKNPETSILNK